MPATLTTVNAITKEVYEGRLQSWLQNEAVAIRRIEGSSEGVEERVGGKYVTFPVKVRRNSGIGYRNEMELLQNAGQQGYTSVRVPIRYGYGRVKMSRQTMRLAAKDYQAFASAMDEEMSGLKDDILKDSNRIVYGDGQGTLATLTAAQAGGNTATVDTVQYLELGFQIDIGTTAQLTGATAPATNRQITAIDDVNNVITFDGAAAALTNGSLVVRTGNYAREPNGFKSIVSNTGVLESVDPAVEPKWKSIVDANGGVPRALSEGQLIANTDRVRVNGGKTTILLSGLGVRRAYFNLLSQQRRYPDTKTFAGGFEALEFHNGRSIPFVDDPDAPPGTVYGLDESKLKVYRDQPWSWIDDDGGIWKWVTGYDAFEAVLAQYWELATSQRNAHFVLKDIIEG
jgi:hypothetical protein